MKYWIARILDRLVSWIDDLPCPFSPSCKPCKKCGRCEYHSQSCT